MLDWIYQLQLSAPSHLDDDERAQDSSWVEQSFDILDDIAGRGGGGGWYYYVNVIKTHLAARVARVLWRGEVTK